MKWISLLSLLFFLVSCEKEETKTKILSASVNGNNVTFTGGSAYRYTNYKDGSAFRYDYHIFNLESPNIYIEADDSVQSKTHFDMQNLTAKYSSLDGNGDAKSYNATDGELNITKETEGILYGNFTFTFINILDNSDTIFVRNGYFEISLEEYDRIW